MKTLVCTEANYDSVNDTCSAPTWDTAPSLFPELTASEGLEIAVAIATCWIVAYVLRVLVKWSQQQ